MIQPLRPPTTFTWCSECERYISAHLLDHAKDFHPEILSVVRAMNAHAEAMRAVA